MATPLDENLYRDILDNLYDGVYFCDRERRITYWNKGAERISGYTADQVMGHACHENLLNHITENGVQLCFGGCPLHSTIQDGAPRVAEVFLHHADGHRVPVVVRTSPMRNGQGEITGAVETFTDNSRLFTLRRRMDRLEQVAITDPLTKIGNRRHLDIQLQSSLSEFQQTQIPFGILFVDIDHFKQFNDRFGHDVGDMVLKVVAHTLQQNLRTTDAVGRWGGEEFLLILEDIDLPGLQAVAEKLRLLVAGSDFRDENLRLGVTISIGGTLARFEDDPASLFQRADRNLYTSKHTGRNKVTVE